MSKRRGHPRIEIKGPSDLELICCDMFDEFLVTFTEEQGLIREVRDEEKYWAEEEGFDFLYTKTGKRLAETMKRRLIKVCEKAFPEHPSFDISSGNYREP